MLYAIGKRVIDQRKGPGNLESAWNHLLCIADSRYNPIVDTETIMKSENMLYMFTIEVRF